MNSLGGGDFPPHPREDVAPPSPFIGYLEISLRASQLLKQTAYSGILD
ncbi:MAG: hypothetical protein LDL41_10720 [Coleofasciculus sp. S288]|nr:hypothetical protein [Coleofasciculus sp. S288]